MKRGASLPAFCSAFRSAFLLPALLPALLGACGEEPAVEGQDGALLTATGGIRLWPQGVIPVCVQDTAKEEAGASDWDVQRARAIVEQAAQLWQGEAHLRFDWSCPANARSRLLVWLRPVKDAAGIAGKASLGEHPRAEMHLSYCAPSLPGSRCDQHHDGLVARRVDPERWLRFTALHELGHVLGFVHEHKRIDTPPDVQTWCPSATDEQRNSPQGQFDNGFVSEGAINLGTAYDRASVMNYCRDMDDDRQIDLPWTHQLDYLSEGDRQGVRRAYRAPDAQLREALASVDDGQGALTAARTSTAPGRSATP